MKRSSLILVLIAWCMSATGQDDPNAQLKAIDFIVGQWVVDVEARLSLQGPWENSKGSSVIKYSLEGSLVEEEFTGTRKGEAFLSKTLMAYNDQANRFQRVFIDAPHGILLEFEGALDGDSFVFDKTVTFPNGNSVKLRTAYTKISGDSFAL